MRRGHITGVDNSEVAHGARQLVGDSSHNGGEGGAKRGEGGEAKEMTWVRRPRVAGVGR